MTRLTEKVVRYGLRPLTFATPDALPRPIVHPDAAFGMVVQYAVAAKHASRTSSAWKLKIGPAIPSIRPRY